MKIKNLITNIIFDLPKENVENLIAENPNIYEKLSKKKNKKNNKEQTYTQNTLLPLILE